MPRKSASVVAATRSYESWVSRQVPLVRSDLAFKHEQMALAPFPFLRSTFYRWVQVWAATCPELARAPRVLAVGDLHTENFGTWRDTEGRLIWGINDFDEAFPMAYTNDLVRLATSARLSISAGTLVLTPRAACNAILEGYRTSHRTRRPAVRPRRGAPRAPPRRAVGAARPGRFWTAMGDLPPARRPLAAAVSLLRRQFGAGRIRATSPGARGSGASGTRASSRSPSTPAAGSLERPRSSSPPASPGRRALPGPSRSTTRRSSGARCGARIPSSRSAGAGCFAGSRPTAAGSSSRSRASPPSRPTCCPPWAPRPQTSTSGPERAGSPR